MNSCDVCENVYDVIDVCENVDNSSENYIKKNNFYKQMVWWLFKKNGLHKKVDNIHNSIQNSFVNIKEDMTKLNNLINQLHQKHSHHSNKISEMEKRIAQMESYLLGDKGIKEETVPKKELENYSSIETLTLTQRKILLSIYQLQQQINKAISIRSLAKIVYPDKKYNQVRSMLSEYTSILLDFKLINRERMGKNTYVSMTNRGNELIKKSTPKKKRIIL